MYFISSMLHGLFDLLQPLAVIAIFTFSIFSFLIMRESVWLGLLSLIISTFFVLGLSVNGAIPFVLAMFAIVPTVLVAGLVSLISLYFLPEENAWAGYFGVAAATGVLLGGFVWYDQTVPSGSCSDTSVEVIVQDETYRVPIELRAELKGPWRNNRYAWEHGYRTDNRDEDRRDLRAVCALSEGGIEPIIASTIDVQGSWRTFEQIETACQVRSPQDPLCQGYSKDLLQKLVEFQITTQPQTFGYFGSVGTSCSGEPPEKIRCISRIDYENRYSILARTDHVAATSQEELEADLNRIIEYLMAAMQSH